MQGRVRTDAAGLLPRDTPRSRFNAGNDEDERSKITLPTVLVPPVEVIGAIGMAFFVTTLLLVANAPEPAVEMITCQADTISPDGIMLIGERCWSLSSEGVSCAESCGSGAAVDAEATVRGSGDAAVQRALAPGATTGGMDCGRDAFSFPYGGLALLRDEKWECVNDASFVHLSAGYRSPCVCQTPPPPQTAKMVARAALITPAATATILALAAAFDYLMIDVVKKVSPPPVKAFDAETADPMTMLKSCFTLSGSAAALADVVTDVLVIVSYANDGDWGFFWVASVLLSAASAVSGVIATGALYPAFDGLDFGSRETAAEYIMKKFGQSWEQAHNNVQRDGRAFLLQAGYWPRRVRPAVSFSLGIFGLSTPAQGVYDVFCRGRATSSFGALKGREAVDEAAPQLYIVLTSMTTTGLRLTLTTRPLKIASACLSMTMLAYGVGSAWSEALTPHRQRFYAGSLHRKQLLVAGWLYVLSSMVLRGAAFSIAAAAVSVPQGLTILALAYAATLCSIEYAMRDGSGSFHGSKLLAAGFQLLAPRVGDGVSSRYLWCDTLVSTGVALLAGFGGLYAPGLPRPHLDPGYVSGMAALLVGAAICKLCVFGACVWPARMGGGPMWLEQAGDEAAEGVEDGTRLHHACANGSVWLARRYLAAGVEVRGWKGRTPLHSAAEHGQVTTARWLLEECGAAVDAANDRGSSPLLLACVKGHEAMARVLLMVGRASVNEAENSGCTPLYMGCQNGHEASVRLLLERGAAINQTANEGATPLYIACQNGHEATARVLVERGAVVDQATNDGETPLWVACDQGYEATARMLLEGGAAVDQARDNGETPLFIACQEGHKATVRVLLEHWAAVGRARDDGETPLHIARYHGHVEIVQWLIQAVESGRPGSEVWV